MFFPSAAQKALHFVCFGVVENPLQQVTHEPSAQHCEHWSLFTGVAQLFVQAAIAELAKANPSTAVNATHTIHLFLVVMILTAFLQGFQKNIPRLRNLPPPRRCQEISRKSLKYAWMPLAWIIHPISTAVAPPLKRAEGAVLKR